MKRYLILPIIALALTAAACTQLSPEDRKLLTETHAMAQEARDQSIQATDLAKQAQASAAQAATSAQAAQASAAQAAADAQKSAKKADRIFRKGEDK
jgi:hypothetical protein